jgi:pSer/pThr/pTyr-binding forkhead associated (FHA) protein
MIRRDGKESLALDLGPGLRHLGRMPDNDVVLTEGTVSAKHCAIWAEAGRVYVRDLSSKNGTFVNNERVYGATEVSAGDEIRLGEIGRAHV